MARSARTGLLLLIADCVALFIGLLFVALIRHWSGGYIFAPFQAPLLVILLFVPIFNYLSGLYGKTPPALPEELRTLGISTTLAYFCLGLLFFLGQSGEPLPSRFVFLVSWFVSLGVVPLARCWVRNRFCRQSWWGAPVVIMGGAALADLLESHLKAHPAAGLNPLAIYPPRETTSALLQLEDRAALESFRIAYPDACCVVALERSGDSEEQQSMIDLATLTFRSVVLAPESFVNGDVPFWIRPLEIGNGVCLKVRQNLLDPRRIMLKHCVDFVGALLGILCLLPVFAAIACCICMESPGPVFFRQNRIGCGGRGIRVLKFRTMIRDAEAVLQAYLDSDPALRAEWDADQKLRHDPRITRVGDFLRRTSLDELPQLWNVLWGEMSLVGPRPIVQDEIARYGTSFEIYTRVRPGITGLWQVSGRNDLSYAQRVHCDRYYIYNWSTWLDVLIIARTIPVVLGKKGAY